MAISACIEYCMKIQYSNGRAAPCRCCRACRRSCCRPCRDGRRCVAASAAGCRRGHGRHSPGVARCGADPETLHPACGSVTSSAARSISRCRAGLPCSTPNCPAAAGRGGCCPNCCSPIRESAKSACLRRSLAAAQRNGRLVMLFDPPAKLSAQALAQLGIDVAQLLVVNTRTRVIPGADSLWALEQALKSGHVGAVVAWLPPRLRAERLRRLQLAAQAHDGPAFVMREFEARHRPTAAPLRLALRPGGGDALLLRVLKRRGPPLETTLQLELPPVLSGDGGATRPRRCRAGQRCRPAPRHATKAACMPRPSSISSRRNAERTIRCCGSAFTCRCCRSRRWPACPASIPPMAGPGCLPARQRRRPRRRPGCCRRASRPTRRRVDQTLRWRSSTATISFMPTARRWRSACGRG